ncbi:hypothetical protein D3C71_494610 [compost metagenome]
MNRLKRFQELIGRHLCYLIIAIFLFDPAEQLGIKCVGRIHKNHPLCIGHTVNLFEIFKISTVIELLLMINDILKASLSAIGFKRNICQKYR